MAARPSQVDMTSVCGGCVKARREPACCRAQTELDEAQVKRLNTPSQKAPYPKNTIAGWIVHYHRKLDDWVCSSCDHLISVHSEGRSTEERLHPPGTPSPRVSGSSAATSATSPRGSGSGAATSATRPNCLEAQRLIPTGNPKKMVASTLQFTDVDMPFHGRDEVMVQVHAKINVFSDATKLKRAACNKGRPIIGTAATSGAGKSRLLHEIRSAYEEKDFIVLIVNYNSLEEHDPTHAEMNKSGTVKEAFLNRLVSGMLAREHFNRATMTRRFDVSDDKVATLISKCFPKQKILILVDEVVQLKKEDCIDAAISAAGIIAAEVSQKNNAECISFVTALSQKVMDRAMTMSKRRILMVDLPLLPRDAVKALVKKKAPTASESQLERATDFIFAITAGHPRSISWFYAADWKDGLPKATMTLEGAILAIAETTRGSTLTEKIVIALLGGNSKGVDFTDLSRKAIVYQDKEKRWNLVPVFLFVWADKETSPFAVHLKKCLLAAWDGIFVKDEKQGTGLPLERLLRHYEVVRRVVVGTDKTDIAMFLCVPSTVVPQKWRGPLCFPPITSTEELTQPASKKWEDFDANSIVDNRAKLYFPGSHSPNFPLYDWFTVAKSGRKEIRIGGQCKHGGGKTNAPDSNTVSVFFTTESAPGSWEGWIVMNRERMITYLSPTIAAAASCLLFRPADDQPAGKKSPSKARKTTRTDDQGSDEAPRLKKTRR